MKTNPAGSSSIPVLRRFKALALGALAGLSAAALAARADEPQPAPSAPAAISVAGSTTLTAVARAAAQRYAQRYSGLLPSVEGSGSLAALRALGAGTLDIALTDFAPTIPALSDHRIAVLTFAFVVNPASRVTTLTRAQLRDVLRGKLTNWSQAGGADLPITVIGRGAHSGVTQLVQRLLLEEAPLPAAGSVAEATLSSLDAVKRIPGAVTVAAVAPARAAKLTLLAIDGAPPDDAHVIDGSYPLWSYEHAVTAGPPSTAVSRYLGILESDRTALAEFGFIAVRDLGPAARIP